MIVKCESGHDRKITQKQICSCKNNPATRPNKRFWTYVYKIVF